MNQANHIHTVKPCKTTPYQFCAMQTPLEKILALHGIQKKKKTKQTDLRGTGRGQQLYFQASGSEFK